MLEQLQSTYEKSTEDNVWHADASDRNFDYSDGDDIENRILDIVTNSRDNSIYSPNLASVISDWPSQYHLSSRRANLLRPVLELIRGDVLEIGAGCGAITRFLGEEQKNVIALEGSYRRATIAARRCADLPTVQVLVDNFDLLKLDSKFDTIIAIGVFEYSRNFFHSADGADSCDAFLAHAAKFLKPGGRLILAIENQLGLKYFAGYREDHTGESFFGIEDRYQPGGVVTFGRAELKARLANNGFAAQQWWYPFPDYKLPMAIISEQGLRDERFDSGTLCSRSVISDPQRPDFSLFSLERAWRLIERNGLIADLANSFLVVASRKKIPDSPNIAFHFGDIRRKEFAKIVQFRSTKDGIRALRTPIFARANSVQTEGITHNLEDEDYLVGELWHDRLIQIVNGPAWSLADLTSWAKVWWEAFVVHAALSNVDGELTAFSRISGKYIDCIPRNMLVNSGQSRFFDQEWEPTTKLEVGFILFRGLFDALNTMTACGQPQPGVSHSRDQLIIDLAYGLGFWFSRDDIRRYKDIESQFQERAGGSLPHFAPQEFGAALLPIRMKLDNVEAAQARLSKSEARAAELETALHGALAAGQQREQALDGTLAERTNEREAARVINSETAACLVANEARAAELRVALQGAITAGQHCEQALDGALAERAIERETARLANSETAACLAASETRAAELEVALRDALEAGQLREQTLNGIVAERVIALEAVRLDNSRAAAHLAASEARAAELEVALQGALTAGQLRERALNGTLAERVIALEAARFDNSRTAAHLAGSETRAAELEIALQGAHAAGRLREQALNGILAERNSELEAARADCSETATLLVAGAVRAAESEAALRDALAASQLREQALNAELEAARTDRSEIAARLAAKMEESEDARAAGQQREQALMAELDAARADHGATATRIAASRAEFDAALQGALAADQQRERALNGTLAALRAELDAARADVSETAARSAESEKRAAELESALQVALAAAEQREQALNGTLAGRGYEVEAARLAERDAERREQALRTSMEAARDGFEAQIRALRSQLVDVEAASAKSKLEVQSAILHLGSGKRRWARKLIGSGLFDADWYASQYGAAVIAAGGSPAAHYLEEGYLIGYLPNPLFDSHYYLDRNEDVRRSGVNPLVHYFLHGFEEGRDPGPGFQTEYYLEANADVRGSGANPLAHYLRFGRHEGRLPVRPG